MCLTAVILLRRGHLRISTTGQWFLLLMGFFCNRGWSSSGSDLMCPTELYIPGWKISLKTDSEAAEPMCFLKFFSLAGHPADLLCGKCAAAIFWLVRKISPLSSNPHCLVHYQNLMDPTQQSSCWITNSPGCQKHSQGKHQRHWH